MATWDQLRAHIHESYTATDLAPEAIEMEFATTARRSQTVYVTTLVDAGGEQWVSIDSVIGHEYEIDLIHALHLVRDTLCGGLAHLLLGGKDMISIRHTFPLEHLDAPEFDKPLVLVTAAADALERELTRDDAY